jgi:hypothetical protein
VARRGGEHLALAGELALAVDRAGAGRVRLQIGTRRAGAIERSLAVEDVVGGEMHERHTRRGGRAREVAGAVGVDGVRLLTMGLRAVDVGPGGAVERRAGANALEGLPDGGSIGDVELGTSQPHQLVAGALARAQHVGAEHPGGACDEQPHRIEMSELSPTMNL